MTRPQRAPPSPSTASGGGKRFLLQFGSATVAALLGVALVNFIVNPLALYPATRLAPVVWASRGQKLALLANMNPKPAVLVLGSSRSMQIAPIVVEQVTGLRAFNFAVDSARAEDYYAIVRHSVEVDGVKPRLIIIGADVEAFHDQVPVDERIVVPALARYLTLPDQVQLLSQKASRLVSWQQTLFRH